MSQFPKELEVFRRFTGLFQAKGEPADKSQKPFSASWELKPLLDGAAYLETYREQKTADHPQPAEVCFMWGYDQKTARYTRHGINAAGEWATADGFWNGDNFTWNVNPAFKFVFSLQGKHVKIEAMALHGGQWTCAATINCSPTSTL